MEYWTTLRSHCCLSRAPASAFSEEIPSLSYVLAYFFVDMVLSCTMKSWSIVLAVTCTGDLSTVHVVSHGYFKSIVFLNKDIHTNVRIQWIEVG